MNINFHGPLRATLLALVFSPLAAVAEARMAFDAGQAAQDRGDGAQANDLYRTAVATDPDFTYAWINLSNVSFSTEEFNAALQGAERGAAKASDGERILLEINKLFLTNNFD